MECIRSLIQCTLFDGFSDLLLHGQFVNDCKRIFYYILFQSKSDGIVMEYKYFEDFVCCESFGEYNCDIGWCIDRFRDNIPNFLLPESDPEDYSVEEKQADEKVVTPTQKKNDRKCTFL